MATASVPAWRTSSYSGNGNACVEVAPGPRAVLVRDTKDYGLGPILMLDRTGWNGLRAAAQAGGTGSTAGLVIAHDERRTVHRGAEAVTTWHVTWTERTLHFTEAEWTAFAAGVRDGEFTFAPA